jgi:hypothetical protein
MKDEKAGRWEQPFLENESNMAERTVYLHNVLHAHLLGGRHSEEGTYTLEEFETFSLGNRDGTLDEVPFQADIYEKVTEVEPFGVVPRAAERGDEGEGGSSVVWVNICSDSGTLVDDE